VEVLDIGENYVYLKVRVSKKLIYKPKKNVEENK